MSSLTSAVMGQGQYSKLCNEGFSYEKSGNLDAAIAKYASAITLKPEAWEAYSYRAKANFRRGRTDEALTDISQAITLSPATVSLYEVRSEINSAKGNREKAIEDLGMVIARTDKKDTKLYRLYSSRGQHLYWLEKYEPAISDFTSAIQIATPGSRDAAIMYSYRATSYFRLGKFQEAIADFDQQFSSSQGGDISSIFYQGLAFMKTGNRERANANARKLIEMDPSKEVYFSGDKALDIYDLEMRRKNTKQYMDEAKGLLAEEKSMTSKSLASIKLNDAFDRLNKAWLYSSGLDKDDREMKDQILKELFSVHSRMKPKPEIPEAARKYMVQANSATNEKKYQEAIGLWAKVQSIAPWYPTSYFNTALLNENLGNFRSSIENMNKYLELYPDASDARAAKDKIYEWEGKVKGQPQSQSSTGAPISDIMFNQAAPYVPEKPKVFFRGGLAMPTGNTKLAPAVPVSGSAPDAVWQSIFY
ncbi:MAG: tetratricopeptide repeat protein, partial [Bacteroidales bacterium]|nr:tetratricopeptide repeat protein [Bacteroidales bacterium]